MNNIEFVKYQGLGNDFILLDNRQSTEPLISPKQAVAMCDRHFGIGADGVILALPAQGETDYTMRIYNADGSEPEMCGNGIRCLAQFLAHLEGTAHLNPTYRIATRAGVIKPRLEADGQVTVDMGPPQLRAGLIPTTLAPDPEQVINLPLEIAAKTWLVSCVSMGNPHCIIFVEDVEAVPLATIGPLFEHHQAFPARTNTEFIQVISSDYLKMRVWERGAGATLACGTGACASVVAAVLNGKSDRLCTVELPGGCLKIHWQEEDGRVYMTGPAQLTFHGSFRALMREGGVRS